MRLLKISAFVLMLLGCTGWLMADIPDPTIRLSIPGTGTFDLCTASAGNSCTTILVDGNPDTTFGDNGLGSFAVKNVDPSLAIDSIQFFFQTDNLFQAFSASTDDFSTVNIVRHENEGCPFVIGDSCQNPVGSLEVDFSGMVAKSVSNVGGSFSLAGIACAFEGCPTDVGFVPHSNVTVVSRYNFVPDPTICCDGIQPGEEGRITASAVPEPSSFVLLIGAAGLLAIKRKFRFHRT